MYLPGLPESPATLARPDLLTGIKFVLAYLGAPIAFMIRFPSRGIFTQDSTLFQTAFTGFLVISFACFLAFHARSRLNRKNPSTVLFVGFSVFAIISASATALGRAAFDASGAAAANSSRYALFGSYFFSRYYFL